VRKLLVLLLAAVLTSAFAATAIASGDGDAAVRAAKTRTVDVRDSYFAAPGRDRSIRTIRVRKGTIVKWVWGKDGAGTGVEHNVRGYRGQKFRSEYMTEGTFRKRIKRTTRILCDVHATTMRMKIRVRR
jgi:plastocyanin